MSTSIVAADELQRRRNLVNSPLDFESVEKHLAPSSPRGSSIKATPPSTNEASRTSPSLPIQIIRGLLLAAWFWGCSFSIAMVQYIGLPLYPISKRHYYAWIKGTKASIGLLVVSMTQFFSPSIVEVSCGASCADQIHSRNTNERGGGGDSGVQLNFAPRMVLLANHQLYNDWAYLWWAAYSNRPQQQHSAMHIILKDEIKYIPVIGTGLRLSGFVFMSRKMAVDQPRLERRLAQLSQRVEGVEDAGAANGGVGVDADAVEVSATEKKGGFTPMWLMMFPEGTNMGVNGRRKSAAWAEKAGMVDFKHQLIPRSAGTYFCLRALGSSVEWVYDCTLAYDGIPDGKYGQDVFPLYEVYMKGKSPNTHMHWRRYRVKDIPLESLEEFDKWLLARWREKDELLEIHKKTGHFPCALPSQKPIRTRLALDHWSELWRVFAIWAVLPAYGIARYVLRS